MTVKNEIPAFDNWIDEFISEYYSQIESLTKEQLRDAMLGAIKSGDFQRHIYNIPFNEMKQGLSYIPYRDKLFLNQKIKDLLKLLFLTHEKVSDLTMNETSKRLIEAYWDLYPEDRPMD